MKAENPNRSRNVARFFVNRQIAWVALFAHTCLGRIWLHEYAQAEGS